MVYDGIWLVTWLQHNERWHAGTSFWNFSLGRRPFLKKKLWSSKMAASCSHRSNIVKPGNGCHWLLISAQNKKTPTANVKAGGFKLQMMTEHHFDRQKMHINTIEMDVNRLFNTSSPGSYRHFPTQNNYRTFEMQQFVQGLPWPGDPGVRHLV